MVRSLLKALCLGSTPRAVTQATARKRGQKRKKNVTKIVAKKPARKTKKLPYVVVRTYSAGVHFGELKSRKGKEVVLVNARRLWKWVGAFTLSEVAVEGIKDGSKPSVAVESITLTEAIEVIATTPAAEKILREFPPCRP